MAECVQIWRCGGSCARSATQPSRITAAVGWSGSLPYKGVPQAGQNTCARRLPLCATLMEVVGEPDSTKLAMGARTMARHGAPDMVWQSVQWQTTTSAGSTSAVK